MGSAEADKIPFPDDQSARLKGIKMRKPSVKPTEHKCPACNGTGFPMVMQPVKPSSRIYPVQCKNCGGKGRIAATAN
jgi:transcription elongation factor Elf1